MINFINLLEEKLDISILKKLGMKILKEAEIHNNEIVNCIFTDNKYIKQLNEKYRRKDAPTDVLSFSFIEGEDSEYRKELFGDIYISIEMAKDNAKQYGQNFFDEVKLLFVHGMLHLLGYDDENDTDKKIMKEKEKYYLK